MPKSRKVKKGTKIRRSKCKSCVFRPEKDGGIELTPSRRIEIQAYLLQGVNQLCHHDEDKTICRGGREFQLQCWHRMGIIEEPTDAALREAMEQRGQEPGDHI